MSSHQEDVEKSLSPVKVLLHSLFCRLQLNGRHFEMFESAKDSEISDFWSAILAIDSTVTEGGVYCKDSISQHERVCEFISHCCQSAHYTFDILKCGISTCSICKPPRLPDDIFRTLKHIPHPSPMEDGHYFPFSDAFSMFTSEEHCPSFKAPQQKQKKRRKLSYYATVQHVKNADMMVQCGECQMWRLVFSRYKLGPKHHKELQEILNDQEYSCGASLKDLQLPDVFKDVEIREHDCYDPIERPYYSTKFSPICVYCAIDQPFTIENEYPKCSGCIEKSPIYIVKKKKKYR